MSENHSLFQRDREGSPDLDSCFLRAVLVRLSTSWKRSLPSASAGTRGILEAPAVVLALALALLSTASPLASLLVGRHRKVEPRSPI